MNSGALSFNDESLEALILDNDAKPEYLALEIDCYSVAAAKNSPICVAFTLPLVAAASQLIVLYFLAIGRGNIFQDGHWIEPVSVHSSVNVMVFISLSVSVFKISTEFQHAQRLYSALVAGELGTHCKRILCWWALCLQYAMASAVLIVSVNLVLAAESCQGSILKTLSVFIVVDMDNLMARFLRVWLPLEFIVDVKSSGCQSPSTVAAESCETPSAHTTQVNTSSKASGKLYGNVIFHGFPVILLAAEIIFAVSYGTLPLTLLFYGCVSNLKAPVIPVEPVCSDVVAGHATCSALILAPEDEAAPHLRWIGLKAFPEPRHPTPFEVMMGVDGTANPAYLSGSTPCRSVQVQEWIRSHNFSSNLYDRLVKHNFLYQSFLPYHAKFDVRGLEVYGMAFRLYVAAQNNATKALSASAPSSRLFYVHSHCEENCRHCEKYNFKVCLECLPRMHLSQNGKCEACPPLCTSCLNSSKQCDANGCELGFRWNISQCTECGVEHCATCDDDWSCQECENDYGLVSNVSGDFCLECDDVCAVCDVSDRSRCLECRIGYGLKHNTCLPCPHKCQNCTSEGSLRCNECARGWGLVFSELGFPECKRCDDEDDDCIGCHWNPRGDFKCTACKNGKSMTPEGRCDSCGDRCRKCSEAGFCDECHAGFALTKSGDECKRCADNCQSCTSAGPGGCDQCKEGFTKANSTKTRSCVREHQEDSDVT